MSTEENFPRFEFKIEHVADRLIYRFNQNTDRMLNSLLGPSGALYVAMRTKGQQLKLFFAKSLSMQLTICTELMQKHTQKDIFFQERPVFKRCLSLMSRLTLCVHFYI